MSSCFLSWQFPCEVEVVEDWLCKPAVVTALNCVGEISFEEFVALEEAADDWNFCLDNCVETFRTIF